MSNQRCCIYLSVFTIQLSRVQISNCFGSSSVFTSLNFPGFHFNASTVLAIAYAMKIFKVIVNGASGLTGQMLLLLSMKPHW